MERLARDKYSGLLRSLESYNQKSVAKSRTKIFARIKLVKQKMALKKCDFGAKMNKKIIVTNHS